jgi:hypothetical protein
VKNIKITIKRKDSMNIFKICSLIITMSLASAANAVLIDFTGGLVTQLAGPGGPTDTATLYDNVDFYVEDGMKFDFIGPPGDPFSYSVGDYYGVGNDVIHGHWAAGPFGDMEEILVTKIDGTAFDLNYFKITTNTDCGGCAASGNEEVFLNALENGTDISFSMMLPPDDWGFAGPNSELFLGPEFDDILAFSVTYGCCAVGFGMDEFFIDEEGPRIPEPTTLALLSLGILGFGLNRRNKKLLNK